MSLKLSLVTASVTILLFPCSLLWKLPQNTFVYCTKIYSDVLYWWQCCRPQNKACMLLWSLFNQSTILRKCASVTEDKMVRVFLCIASPLRYLQNLNWILKSLTNQSRSSEIETQKRGNQNVPTNFYFSVVQ